MSPQEREGVEYGYQGFLNSLYFPVQIFVRSQKVDIGPYIQKLDKIRSEHDNMLLALLMEDYKATWLHWLNKQILWIKILLSDSIFPKWRCPESCSG